MIVIFGRKKKILILFGLFAFTAVFLFQSYSTTNYNRYVNRIIQRSQSPGFIANTTTTNVSKVLPWRINDLAENLATQSLTYLTEKILNSFDYRKGAALLPTCDKERTNFVYIKNHKCGSDSTAAMFRRFGYVRNLSLVMPIRKRYNIGWPYQLLPSYYRASKHGNNSFNILCEHTVFNESLLSSLMPKDSVYITTIREPFERLKSAFFFFGVEKIARITDESANANDQLEIFLKKPAVYDERFVQPNPIVLRPCVPNYLSVSRNAMAFDLGFPTGYHLGTIDQQTNLSYVKDWLRSMDQRFDIVLILDHLHESQVMLKRMMCWSFKDILFKKISTSNPNKRITRSFPTDLVDNYHMWSFVDYVLYKHFQRTFWERIRAMGLEDFMGEVQFYREVLHTSLEFCENEHVREFIEFPRTRWGAGFVVSKTDCQLIKSELREELKERYDNDPTEVKQPEGPVAGC